MEEILATLLLIQNELDEQKNTIKESGAQVTEKVTQNINKIIDEKFKNWEEKFEDLQQKVDKQEQRLELLERQIRKRNLVIFGLAEQEHNYSELENMVIDFTAKHLSILISHNEIQELKRIGKKSQNPRPIVLSLTTLGKKIAILQKKKLLKDTNYYIKEDYPPQVLEKRRQLQEQLKSERQRGVKAMIKYDKLVILENSKYSPIPEKNKKRFLSTSPQEKQICQTRPPSGTQANKKNKTSLSNTVPSTNVNRSEGLVKPGILNYFVNKTPTYQGHPNQNETE